LLLSEFLPSFGEERIEKVEPTLFLERPDSSRFATAKTWTLKFARKASGLYLR
jgi:hypothetical protein